MWSVLQKRNDNRAVLHIKLQLKLLPIQLINPNCCDKLPRKVKIICYRKIKLQIICYGIHSNLGNKIFPSKILSPQICVKIR